MAALEIKIQKLRDKTYELTVKDQAGAAVNIAGATAKLSVREKEGEPNPPIKTYKTSPGAGEGTINITDGANGKLQVLFVSNDFSAIEFPIGKAYFEWRWDLLVVLSGSGKRLDSRNGDDYVHKFFLFPAITE